MYRRHISQLKPGQVLARSIYTERGDVLLGAGTSLSQFYIDRLGQRGVITVFLRDGLGDDVEPNDIVSEELRAATVTHLARAFDVIGSMAHATKLNGGHGPQTVDGLVSQLGERPLDMPPAGVNSIQALYQDIEALMNEILESNTIASLESLKTHNDYTFQHSVDVAVLGILLGRTAGLPRDQLRELALGCLLHDLGKMYIDEAILDKPDKLTPEEFDEIKKHPQMGFELIRRMPVFSILPAHVAYQHHERQDGEGYPRGLIGNNVLGRSLSERMNPQPDAADRRDLRRRGRLQRPDLGPAVPPGDAPGPGQPDHHRDVRRAPQRRGRPDAPAHHADVPGRPLDRGPDRHVPGLARRRLRALGGRAPSPRRSGCSWTIADTTSRPPSRWTSGATTTSRSRASPPATPPSSSASPSNE